MNQNATIDLREQLANDLLIGTVVQAMLPVERITSLHGILIDLDPKLYRPGNPVFPPNEDVKTFYQTIKSVLDRHPLARSAEVRMTGTGLHVIIRLSPPVPLTSAAEQVYWQNVVRGIQATLPCDLDAPGITALTRPIGSVNSKNGARVELIKRATPVSCEQIVDFLKEVARAPFKAVTTILFGDSRVTPCPVCRAEGSRLDVLDRVGICYGHCGKILLLQLFDAVYLPRKLPNTRRSRKDDKEPSLTAGGEAGGQAEEAKEDKAEA